MLIKERERERERENTVFLSPPYLVVTNSLNLFEKEGKNLRFRLSKKFGKVFFVKYFFSFFHSFIFFTYLTYYRLSWDTFSWFLITNTHIPIQHILCSHRSQIFCCYMILFMAHCHY